MKPKHNPGEGGVGGLLAQHIEKAVLGVVLVLVVLLVYGGFRRKRIDNSRGPIALKQIANEAGKHLQGEPALALERERWEPPDNFDQRVRDALVKVDVGDYPTPRFWDKPIRVPERPRSDPELYPIEDLEVLAGYGPLAVQLGEGERGGLDFPAETARELSAERKVRIKGYRPSKKAKVRGSHFVRVAGIVPLEKERREYDSRFVDAGAYDESRDVPTYGWTSKGYVYYYMVRRAEVSADGKQGAWKTIANSRTAEATAERLWAGTPEEIADASYVDDRFTQPLPPVLLRDLGAYAVHSRVQDRRLIPPETDTGDAAAKPAVTPPVDIIEPFDMEPGRPAADSTDDAGAGAGPHEGGPSKSPHTDSSKPKDEKEIETDKLFRYFDFDVEPGRSYVYQVRLYLEDPNNPPGGKPKPPLKTLADDVIQRLKKEKSGYRATDWSATSPVATIPRHQVTLAGGVTVPRDMPLSRNGPRMKLEEPTAEVAVVTWDQEKAMEVPCKKTVYRGSVLNFAQDAEALNPFDLAIVKLTGYRLLTDALVLDLRGGTRKNKTPRKGEVLVPGEILIVDADGNLFVRDALNDRNEYRESLFLDTEKGTGGEETSPGTGIGVDGFDDSGEHGVEEGFDSILNPPHGR